MSLIMECLQVGYRFSKMVGDTTQHPVADLEGVPRVPWNPPIKENQKMYLTQTVHSRQKSKLHV